MTTTKRLLALGTIIIIIALFPLIIFYALIQIHPGIKNKCKQCEAWINEHVLNDVEVGDFRFIVISIILILFIVALIVPQKKYYGPDSDTDNYSVHCGPGQPCY